MQKSIEINNKIKVFISSMTGRPKYDEIRKKLKKLIENTGLAKVYIFEDDLGSTLQVQQDYLYELDNSDVCIFLIDNEDGVSEGVLNEHQRAKGYPKKSIYIFCDEKNKKFTEIQKEIINSKSGPKFYVTHSFENFVESGYSSLLNDIGKIYINYSRGKLEDLEFSSTEITIKDIADISASSIDKEIINNTDKTKINISKKIYNRSDREIINTSDFDNYASDFLDVTFGLKTIDEYNVYFLLESIEKNQDENVHSIVKERWKAIQHYWMDNIDKSIEYESKALNLARKLEVSNWLIQDILIDLRNLYAIKSKKNNLFFSNSPAQKELDTESKPIFYPLLDRKDGRFYQELLKMGKKYSTASPYSVTIGNNIDHLGDYISDIYIIAMFYGSLTHILKTLDRLKDLTFNLSSLYSDWEFRVLMLQFTFKEGTRKEVDGVLRRYNEIYGKMNVSDARKIYNFVKGNPIIYQKQNSQLIAFQNLGYYFSEKDFVEVENEIIGIIIHWINDKDKIIGLENNIFNAIKFNLGRLDNNKIIETIILKIFEQRMIRFYEKAFDIILEINLNEVLKINIKKIIRIIKMCIKDEKLRNNIHNLETIIISMRKIDSELSIELDNLIKKFMPDFSQDTYKLETMQGTDLEYSEFIRKYIAIIHNRNESQGKNGGYKGYMDNPYQTIERIISIEEVIISKVLEEEIINVCLETLYSGKQTFSSKVEATKLLSFVEINSKAEKNKMNDLIEELTENSNLVFTGYEDFFLAKTSKDTLRFSFTMMKIVFNSIEVGEVLKVLSAYNELSIFEKSEALSTINDIYKYKLENKIDDNIMLIILQFILNLSNDTDHTVRYKAVEALLNILNYKNSQPIIEKIISIMDYDSQYIKYKILDCSNKIKSIDRDSYDFIIKKAKIDNHYLIRKKALGFEE